jgi:dTDP-4-dehydrorhamnose 3,5-epimerase
VRVIDGEVLDVAVDLRKGSLTFGKWVSILLSGKNKKQLFIPKGFAHGYIVLSKNALFSYKVDNLYFPDHETGIIYNDKTLNIDWKIPKKNILISKKDQNLNSL